MIRTRVLAAFIFILPVALFLFFWLSPSAVKMPDSGQTKPSQDDAVAKALATNSPAAAIIASNFAAPPQSAYYSHAAPQPSVQPAGSPAPLQVTNMEPETALENVRHAIHSFGTMFGGNPVGINSEITSQLMGKNPKHINFIDPDAGMRVNASGELIDPWGTPYFFHQLSGTDMEIHSAGPDRIMWTADDLVISE